MNNLNRWVVSLKHVKFSLEICLFEEFAANSYFKVYSHFNHYFCWCFANFSHLFYESCSSVGVLKS